MTILYGLIAIVLGFAFVFSGLRLFRILIPIWGLFGGFMIGASLATSLFGEGFLASGIGFLLGLAVGLVCAVLSYLFFTVAVVVMTASVGYWFGTWLLNAIGFSSSFLIVSLSLALGAVAGIAALTTNFTRWFIILVSSFGGALTLITGVMLLFGQIDTGAFSLEASRVAVSNSFWWSLAWVAIGLVGVFSQLQLARDYELDEWSYTSTHSPQM